jgi:uncharacterized membrane-anchored protein
MSPDEDSTLQLGAVVPMNKSVEDGDNTARAELLRRARRVGLSYAASSLVIGGLIGWLSRPWYGVMVGAVVLAGGLYFAFAYLPFAAWLRRREQSH